MKQQSELDASSKTVEELKKKNYLPPKLSEYGNIIAVTQNMAAGSVSDMNGKMMSM